MSLIRLKNTAYAHPTTEIGKTVRAALQAFADGAIPEPLDLALRNLLEMYDRAADLPEVERAERYVAECWGEYKNPPGVVHKAPSDG